MKKLLPILILCGIFAVVIPVLAVTIDNPLKHKEIKDIVGAITSLLVVIAVPLAGMMIMWGGIQIMVGMSTGEKEKKVAQGKKTITWAIIGLAIILAADFIIDIIREVVGKAN